MWDNFVLRYSNLSKEKGEKTKYIYGVQINPFIKGKLSKFEKNVVLHIHANET